jgi:hypothetical protein
MTTDIHSACAVAVRDFDTPPARRRALPVLMLAASLLAGCAQMPPMVEQLQADKKTRVFCG